MLDRLTDRIGDARGYTELRWHANHAMRLMMRKGTLLQNSVSRAGGVSARCYRNGAFGFASLPGDDDAAIAGALGEAAGNAALFQRTAGATETVLPRTAPGSGSYDYRSKNPSLSPGDRVDILRQVDAAIGEKYPGLVNSDLILASLAMEKALVTSDGASTYSYIPRATLLVNLAIQANDGLVELYDVLGGFGEIEDQFLDLGPVLERIDALYARLREKAEGTRCEAGVHDVVLDASVAGILAHEAIGHTCEADSVLAGSVAGDHVGRLVASEKITLGDYGGRGPDGRSNLAIHVDDEGTPCRDVTIIENGILKGFLHSKETARLLEAEPTGNARAFTFSDEPIVRMRNTAIAPGRDRPRGHDRRDRPRLLSQALDQRPGRLDERIHVRIIAATRSATASSAAPSATRRFRRRLRHAEDGDPCRRCAALVGRRDVRQEDLDPGRHGRPGAQMPHHAGRAVMAAPAAAEDFAAALLGRAMRDGADGAQILCAGTERFEIDFNARAVDLLRTTADEATTITLFAAASAAARRSTAGTRRRSRCSGLGASCRRCRHFDPANDVAEAPECRPPGTVTRRLIARR